MRQDTTPSLSRAMYRSRQFLKALLALVERLVSHPAKVPSSDTDAPRDLPALLSRREERRRSIVWLAL